MTIKVIESDDEKKKACFILENIDASYANAFRRTVLEDVPTMAIEDVELRKNSSVLYDETIAHRIGMIPLTTDLQSYNLTSKCACKGEGCASCQTKLILKKDGPGIVLASDFTSNDPEIKPAHPEIPIVKLLKGQSLEIEATAVLGTGRDHSKWAPAHIYYKKKPVLKMGDVKNPDEVVNATPLGLFENKNGKLQVNESLLLKHHDLVSVAEQASEGQISLEPTSDYVFYIESFGQLSCREIMEKAADILKERLQEFQKMLK